MPGIHVNNLATIRIKNLRLRTFIGIKDEEIQNRQDVLINVVIHYDARHAMEDNRITSALNYRTITKAIIRHVEDGRFALLERLTQEVLGLVLDHADVLEAEVEIDKPHALRYAESVSVTLRGSRP